MRLLRAILATWPVGAGAIASLLIAAIIEGPMSAFLTGWTCGLWFACIAHSLAAERSS